MMISVQPTNINFDLTIDDESYEWESVEEQNNCQQMLEAQYCKMVYSLEVEDDATEDDIAYELCEIITNDSGWCINNIEFDHVGS